TGVQTCALPISFPFPDLSRAHSLRTMSTEEQSEPTKTEMDDVSVRPDDDHDAGCLQEESGPPATAAPPTAGRADGFAYSQPQHGRQGRIHDIDLADQQLDRRQH